MFACWSWEGWTALVAVGTIGLALVAVFQEVIRKRLSRTNLVFKFVQDEPDCQKIAFDLPGPSRAYPKIRAASYYVRFRVINEGRNPARNVEVFAVSVFKQNDRIESLQRFIPLNLIWSNTGDLRYLDINRQVPSHCDLFHVINPEQRKELETDNPENPFTAQMLERSLKLINFDTDKEIVDEMNKEAVISMDTVVKPNSGSYFLVKGTYIVRLLVVGSNTKKYYCHFRIRLTDEKQEDAGWEEVWSYYLKVEKLSDKEAIELVGKP